MIKLIIFIVLSIISICVSVLTIMYWGFVRDEASYLIPEPDILGDMQWIALLIALAMLVLSLVFFSLFSRKKQISKGLSIFTAIACIAVLSFSITTAGLSVKEKRDLNITVGDCPEDFLST